MTNQTRKNKYEKKIIILVLILLFFLSCNLSPGGYVNAEKYEFHVNEAIMKSVIEEFLEINPEYKLPKSINLREDYQKSHWYFFHLYYKKENRIIKIWIRELKHDNPIKTVLAFVAINEDKGHLKWERINQDLGFFRSREEISLFESRILNKIKDLVPKN